jgi:hypothetical protein
MVNTQSALVNRLADMHTYCRPHGSGAEMAFCEKFIQPLPGAYRDIYGNWHVTVGDAPVLWSAHTDTVHWKSGRQRVVITDRGILQLHRKDRRRQACLGADDTVGVFILCELILAGMPGHYVFHFGEEVGCLGSQALARQNADWLRQFHMAIAFDRGGTTDIISHQSGARTASDAFCGALAAQLNADPQCGLAFARSDRGIFTDTVEYEGIIPECTNVSVGYSKAHSSGECVDVSHVLRLLAALTMLDTSALPIERDPNNRENDWPKTTGSKTTGSAEPGSLAEWLANEDVVWDSENNDEMRMAIVGEDDRFGEGFDKDADKVYLDPAFGAAQRQLKEMLRNGKTKPTKPSWTDRTDTRNGLTFSIMNPVKKGSH